MSDRWALYEGDALGYLAGMAGGSVDALITDPPYSSGGMVRGDRAGSTTRTKYVTTGSGNLVLPDFTGDNRDQRGFGYWCALWLDEARRVVRPGGVACLFTDWRQLPTTTDALQAGGWIWRGIVPWSKPVSRPQLGRFKAQCEYVVWGSNGPLPAVGEALPGFFEASAPRNRDHIAQKPLSVMRELVRIVPAGSLVLDPFAGTGTTGVACIVEGRRFVGCELMPVVAAAARARLTAADLAESAPLVLPPAVDSSDNRS